MMFTTRGRTLRLAAAAGVLALLAACSGETGTGGSTSGFVSPTGGITKVAQADRKDAPVIEGVDLDGKELSSESFDGKVLVVNVWGSWCVPCRKEAPALQEVSEQYADKGVQFLGVNVRDNAASAKRFEETYGVTYPSLDDPSQKSLLAFKDSLPAQGIPTTWIIDADGKVAVRIFVDNVTPTTLAGLIDDVIAGSA
ncbi:TlpA family protein disulfide reductase [Aeromicrobium sp. UC242_57]|uniref:TlpA family protein disulfide reductase n=1 Tax=Aeromicrobium sp. UC242_57 TaxID=3374624 RepID=UPI0037ACBEEC